SLVLHDGITGYSHHGVREMVRSGSCPIAATPAPAVDEALAAGTACIGRRCGTGDGAHGPSTRGRRAAAGALQRRGLPAAEGALQAGCQREGDVLAPGAGDGL